MKIGDKVRTSDPLTACASYNQFARENRRANALGTVSPRPACGVGSWLWVRHADGTAAAYDARELTVILSAEERAEIRTESTPDYKALAAAWEAIARARGKLNDAVSLLPGQRINAMCAAMEQIEDAERALHDLGVKP